jgi:hypothetical protein
MSRTHEHVTRRRFLKHVATAAAAAPALAALADLEAEAAAAKKKAKPVTLPAPIPPASGPDYSIAKNPGERAALEKQWKQMVETVGAIRKASVPAGSEIATGALAPRRLRRGEA